MGGLGEDVRRGGGDKEEVRPPGQGDMADFGGGEGAEHFRDGAPPGNRLKRGGGGKLPG